MLCQNCKKNEATAHIKQIVNGEAAEYRLCKSCAEALGFLNSFSDFGFNLSEFFGGLLVDNPIASLSNKTIRCEKCGSTFDDISKSGKIGCADCYGLFYDKILPSLQRIHGKIRHEGKVSHFAGEEIKKERQISQLKAEMAAAITEQNFELAAKLRDEINEIEKSGENNEKKDNDENNKA